ncbi:hypothetical protein BDR04DRAFT_1111750, partial [Suillus decipiens]
MTHYQAVVCGLCKSSDNKKVHPLLKDSNYNIYRRASSIDKRRIFEEIGLDLSAFDGGSRYSSMHTGFHTSLYPA